MLRNFRSGLFRKIFFSMLALVLIPTLGVGWLAVQSGIQAGETSTELSRTALDEKSQEALELRAVETANAIARFLEEREMDLYSLADLPLDQDVYLDFCNSHQGILWWVDNEGEHRENFPLYKEIAYLDATGQEIVKIIDGDIASSSELKNVVEDDNGTLYPGEDYFMQAVGLEPGEIYVGHMIGFFLDKESYLAGERYQGIYRFAMPVFDGSELQGVVVLALDSRHVAQFTAHILPTEERFAAAPDPAKGSYAYLIDDKAWTLAHPNEFYLYGLSAEGEDLSYVTSVEELGEKPVKLSEIGFIDENLASIHSIAATGKSGSIQYVWQDKEKFVAYAPIPYYGGGYEEPAGFGWLGIGAEVQAFHLAANQVGEAIQAKVQSLMYFVLGVLVLGSVAAFPVAAILARGLSSPIQKITLSAQNVEEGNFELTELESLLEGDKDDELTTLARVFKKMADQVHEREVKLKQTISDLKIFINEARKQREIDGVVETDQFKDLQKQVKELRKKKGEGEDRE
jgi:hypothetical protein